MLDICHILLGQNPDKNNINNDDYKKVVEKIKFELEKDKQNYILLEDEIRDKEVDIDRIKETKKLEIKKLILIE